MRRWLAILMLVLLPIQFAWSAVAEHHEHAPSLAGHHGHAPQGDTPHAGGSEGENESPHIGCDHCHGHCVGLVHAEMQPRGPAPGDAAVSGGDAPRAEPLPTKPERPKWARLA